MLRAFRSKRHDLLNENKTFRYLKYAVGEVLLIMVGIILALQFQNWNENRKLDQQREELIKNLTFDFEVNLDKVETTLTNLDKVMAGYDQFLTNILDPNSSLTIEEIKAGSLNAFSGISFRPMFGAYRSAISSGSISLLNSSTLKCSLWKITIFPGSLFSGRWK